MAIGSREFCNSQRLQLTRRIYLRVVHECISLYAVSKSFPNSLSLICLRPVPDWGTVPFEGIEGTVGGWVGSREVEDLMMN